MKTSINFGLVYIPVVLQLSAKVEEISFNQLDKKTKSRIRYSKTCDECEGDVVESQDIVKAYQYQKDKYVIFEEADFDKLKGETDKSIVIESFVSLDEIDPAYYDKHYYVGHDGNEKGFALLLHLLESENKVAIAKTILGSKEKVIVLRAKSGDMLLSSLFFESELQDNKAKAIKTSPSKQELELGKKLLKSMSAKFEPEKYKDEYAERVKNAIELKIAGKLIKETKKTKSKSVVDLMEALTQSITNTNEKTYRKPKPKTNAIANNKKTIRQGRMAVRAKA